MNEFGEPNSSGENVSRHGTAKEWLGLLASFTTVAVAIKVGPDVANFATTTLAQFQEQVFSGNAPNP